MIGCLRTRVRKKPINVLYFELEITQVLKPRGLNCVVAVSVLCPFHTMPQVGLRSVIVAFTANTYYLTYTVKSLSLLYLLVIF